VTEVTHASQSSATTALEIGKSRWRRSRKRPTCAPGVTPATGSSWQWRTGGTDIAPRPRLVWYDNAVAWTNAHQPDKELPHVRAEAAELLQVPRTQPASAPAHRSSRQTAPSGISRAPISHGSAAEVPPCDQPTKHFIEFSSSLFPAIVAGGGLALPPGRRPSSRRRMNRPRKPGTGSWGSQPSPRAWTRVQGHTLIHISPSDVGGQRIHWFLTCRFIL
jgi:hypothetical protein